MIGKLKEKIKKYLQQDEDHGELMEEELRLATAILLIETMNADHTILDTELQAVCIALCHTYNLTEQEAQELLQLGELRVKDSTSLYEFTSLINDNLTHAQKIHIIEQMWRVVLSDSIIDKHEEHLVRRTADLLYVSHKDFIRTKHQVMEEIKKTVGQKS